jgi:hypothetical protein
MTVPLIGVAAASCERTAMARQMGSKARNARFVAAFARVRMLFVITFSFLLVRSVNCGIDNSAESRPSDKRAETVAETPHRRSKNLRANGFGSYRTKTGSV